MKKIFLVFTLVLSLIYLTACSSNSNTEQNTLSKIQEKGVLTIGTSADYAPYEFHILNDGQDEIVGFEIEIAKKIAEALGVELKIVDMSFDGLLTALNSSQVDMVFAGMTPTSERAEVIDFSDIYYTATQAVVVRTEDLDYYNSIEDFADKKIGVQRNSLQETIFNQYFTNSNLVSLTKIPNIILELKNSTIDATIIELPVAKGYISQYPELSIANIELPVEEGGAAIAMRKGDTELLNAVNEVLDNLIQNNYIEQFVSDSILISEY